MTAPVKRPLPFAPYRRADALASLAAHDPAHPAPALAGVLARPEHDHLLRYLSREAFTHVFPGTRPAGGRSFLRVLERELAEAGTYHLWTALMGCRYRCHFCPFPIRVLPADEDAAAAIARRMVDDVIAEARLWLDAVPALRTTPVGEYCLFGGTPTAFPRRELERLVDFMTSAFRFTGETSARVEGSPDTLDAATTRALAGLGFRNLTYGIQSLDDDLLALANRRHTGGQALDAVAHARRAGFPRVDGDLVWGLPGQTVTGFLDDVTGLLGAGFDTIVLIKLHLESANAVDHAIGHPLRAAWEDAGLQQRLADDGHPWPALGEQLQMREQAEAMLARAGYIEHPTTYFHHRDAGPERWRSLNLDQHLQAPQLGIGPGAYAWTSHGEAHILTDHREYHAAVTAGRLPLGEVTTVDAAERETRAVRMAMSTCAPLREDVHRARFPGGSLLRGAWGRYFDGLARRGLARVDRDAGTVTLTASGRTVVEALINTELAGGPR